MLHSYLNSLVEERIIDNRVELSYRNRTIVYRQSPNVFDRLDFNDDDIFLEPLLFLYPHLPAEFQNLEQLLFGYIPNNSKPDSLTIKTDKKGMVYIPRIGYIYTNTPNKQLKLKWNTEISTFSKEDNTNITVLRIVKPIYIQTKLEIYRDEIAELDSYFAGQENEGSLNVEEQYIRHSATVEKAIDIIKSIYPEYYDKFSKVIRGIYLFYRNGKRSFASLQSIGISYINVEPENSIVSFLEDIIHQSSHNMFYYVLLPNDVFAVDPYSLVKKNSRHKAAHGKIYGSFHALFTLTNINTCLARCIRENVFKGLQLYEAKGRLSDNMKRFKTALEVFNYRKIFTKKGWELYHSLKETYHDIYEENASTIESLDTSNQPYVFSLKKLLEANPISINE